MKKYKVVFNKKTAHTVEAENMFDLIKKTDGMKPGEHSDAYELDEGEIEQDILEFSDNWRIFMKLLVRQPFFHDLKITEDNVISEPKNWPCMYHALEVCQLAEVCGLMALVTLEDEKPKIVIRIS